MSATILPFVRRATTQRAERVEAFSIPVLSLVEIAARARDAYRARPNVAPRDDDGPEAA
jgi:hypothetical protein